MLGGCLTGGTSFFFKLVVAFVGSFTVSECLRLVFVDGLFLYGSLCGESWCGKSWCGKSWCGKLRTVNLMRLGSRRLRMFGFDGSLHCRLGRRRFLMDRFLLSLSRSSRCTGGGNDIVSASKFAIPVRSG